MFLSYSFSNEGKKVKMAIISLIYYNIPTTTTEIPYLPAPPKPYETFDEETAYWFLMSPSYELSSLWLQPLIFRTKSRD
jgi:hypothetical protein